MTQFRWDKLHRNPRGYEGAFPTSGDVTPPLPPLRKKKRKPPTTPALRPQPRAWLTLEEVKLLHPMEVRALESMSPEHRAMFRPMLVGLRRQGR